MQVILLRRVWKVVPVLIGRLRHPIRMVAVHRALKKDIFYQKALQTRNRLDFICNDQVAYDY